MNDEIRRILDQITELETELRDKLQEQQQRWHYRIEGRRVRFKRDVRRAHRRVRVNVLRFLAESSWRHVLSAPFIYSVIVPFALLDLFLAMYQAICFRLYGIPMVRRSDYIVIDRQHLAYLNVIQRINCMYCGYANGLIAYAREITARTEQYWCPIKHARRVRGTHARYARFLDYGESEDFEVRVRDLRRELQKETEATAD
jgi:hypothetical protein